MTDEKRKELFPYFAYLYSKQLDPDKYGNAGSIEEWSSLLQDNQEDVDKITEAAGNLSDEEWDYLDEQYSKKEESPDDGAIRAAKGAKLKKLSMLKKGGMKKKCECGCEVVSKKEQGGQIIEACSCCGKVHSSSPQEFKAGGKLKSDKNSMLNSKKTGRVPKAQEGGSSESASSQLGIAKKGAKIKPKDRIKAAQSGTKFNGVLPVNTKQLPKLNSQSGANSSTVPTNPDGSSKVTMKVPTKKGLSKKEKGGKVITKPVAKPTPKPDPNDETWDKSNTPTGNKSMNPKDWTNKQKKPVATPKKEKGGKTQFNGVIPMNTNQLPKLNSQSGANSSTVPTNPDGSAKVNSKKRITSKKENGGDLKATKDSTKTYMNRLENSKNSKEFDKNADALKRQDKKGKPGFDKNGFPIKKNEKGGDINATTKNRIGKAKITSKLKK